MKIVDAEVGFGAAERALDPVSWMASARDRVFFFEIAEPIMASGRKPTSSRPTLLKLQINGPTFDLPTTLIKFLHAGMSLREVLAAATAKPARVLGLEHEVRDTPARARADIACVRTSSGTSRCRHPGIVRHARRLLPYGDHCWRPPGLSTSLYRPPAP